MGYPVSNLPPTMSSSSSAYKAKTAAFFAYTPYDYQECQSVSLCASQGRAESYWLLRQYVVTPALRTTSTIGSSLAPIALPAGDNIAGSATVTASSTTSGSAAKAIVDGIISGYPGNETAEWSSAHGGVGSWVKLTWKQPVNITALALYDRPNSNDWWKTGTIKFGSEKELTSFTIATNDGTRSIISLAGSHVVTTILLTVTSVSDSTVILAFLSYRVRTLTRPPLVQRRSRGASSIRKRLSSMCNSLEYFYLQDFDNKDVNNESFDINLSLCDLVPLSHLHQRIAHVLYLSLVFSNICDWSCCHFVRQPHPGLVCNGLIGLVRSGSSAGDRWMGGWVQGGWVWHSMGGGRSRSCC